MKYEKISVEVVKFDNNTSFIATSPYTSVEVVLKNECRGYSGNPRSFSCDSFKGYNNNAPKGTVVTIDGVNFTFVFETHGASGRWYCSSV